MCHRALLIAARETGHAAAVAQRPLNQLVKPVAVALLERRALGSPKKSDKNDVSDGDVVVLGSGNLGLVYLMEERRRLTLGEIDERHPQLIGALRKHPHIGWLLVRSAEHGAVALGPDGMRYFEDERVEGEDPLRDLSPRAGICCAPMASPMSPTSWWAASTTRSSTRAVRSRS
jgi:hypothetical protein